MKGFPHLPWCLALLGALSALGAPDDRPKRFEGWSTNGPAVFKRMSVLYTNAGSEDTYRFTNNVFDHFRPGSLNELVWTNLLAHTNGRSMTMWAVRSHSPKWPATAPIVVWNTNSLIWGMKGLTALSPCWEVESGIGQMPVTALTRRHGYARGHGMGPDGFNTNFAGRKVWFATTNNVVVEVTIVRDVVRTLQGSGKNDYTILLFDRDLPPEIEPVRVDSATNVVARYAGAPEAPYPVFKPEQGGNVSADIPGLTVNTWKGGDSGSPNLLPLPGELVFFAGRSTSGPSAEMQADMDQLCKAQGLDPKQYQLHWVDLSAYPTF